MGLSSHHGGRDRKPAKAMHGSPNRIARHVSTTNGQRAERMKFGAPQAMHSLESSFEYLSVSQKEMLARQLGYESFDALLKASKMVTLSDGSMWWMTADRNGVLTAWNLCPLESSPPPQPGETAAWQG